LIISSPERNYLHEILTPHFPIHQLLWIANLYLWIVFLISRIIVHKVCPHSHSHQCPSLLMTKEYSIVWCWHAVLYSTHNPLYFCNVGSNFPTSVSDFITWFLYFSSLLV
jgi:hypothetical protein